MGRSSGNWIRLSRLEICFWCLLRTPPAAPQLRSDHNSLGGLMSMSCMQSYRLSYFLDVRNGGVGGFVGHTPCLSRPGNNRHRRIALVSRGWKAPTSTSTRGDSYEPPTPESVILGSEIRNSKPKGRPRGAVLLRDQPLTATTPTPRPLPPSASSQPPSGSHPQTTALPSRRERVSLAPLQHLPSCMLVTPTATFATNGTRRHCGVPFSLPSRLSAA